MGDAGDRVPQATGDRAPKRRIAPQATGYRAPQATPLPTPCLSPLDLIASLLDKSLLLQAEHGDGEPRLRMHETIRELGLEMLEVLGEAEAVRRQHAEYFLALARQAEDALRGPDQADWLRRLEREHDNLRAALTWSLAGDPTDGIAGESWPGPG